MKEVLEIGEFDDGTRRFVVSRDLGEVRPGVFDFEWRVGNGTPIVSRVRKDAAGGKDFRQFRYEEDYNALQRYYTLLVNLTDPSWWDRLCFRVWRQFRAPREPGSGCGWRDSRFPGGEEIG